MSQTIVTEPFVKKTIEYSYNADGKLIQNFSANEKVNPDSLKNTLKGVWKMKEYESWTKEKRDSLPIILKFDDDNITLLKGIFPHNTISLDGNYSVLSNNAEGAEIKIININSSPNFFYKIEMYVFHCESNIVFVSIMTYDSITSNIDRGIFKLTREE